MIVVAGRVVERREGIFLHSGNGFGREGAAKLVEIVGVGVEHELIVVAQTVKTNVLIAARFVGIVESVGEGVFGADAAPHGGAGAVGSAVVGQTVFVRFQTIFENIFREFAKVEIEVATFVVGVLGIEEGVEHPELNVFDVALLEVGVIESAHDAAPTFFGIGEIAFGGDVDGVEVVGAAFVGVEGEVEGLDGGGFAVGDLAVRIELARGDFADVGVGELFQVAFDIAGRKGGVARGEHAVDVIPVEQRAVFAIVNIV